MTAFLPTPDGLPDFTTRSCHTIDFLRQSQIPRLKIQPGDFPSPTEEEADSVTAAPEWLRPCNYDRDPDTMKPGALRLLSSWLLDTDTPPMVMMVLGEWAPGFPLIIPFSSYFSPATQAEMLTGMDLEPLQVLQIWNARSAPSALVSEGWYLGQAPEQLVADAMELHRAVGLGQSPIPKKLLPRLGCAILSASDPRRAHLREGIADLAPLLRASLVWESWRASLHGMAEGDSSATVIPFPQQQQTETYAVSNLAAAADEKVLRCRRIKRTFGELASRSDGNLYPGSEHPEEDAFFVQETTPPAPSTETGHIIASFSVRGRSLQPGLPFLLLEDRFGTVEGMGEVNLDGNLDISHASSKLLHQSYTGFHIVLPYR